VKSLLPKSLYQHQLVQLKPHQFTLAMLYIHGQAQSNKQYKPGIHIPHQLKLLAQEVLPHGTSILHGHSNQHQLTMDQCSHHQHQSEIAVHQNGLKQPFHKPSQSPSHTGHGAQQKEHQLQLLPQSLKLFHKPLLYTTQLSPLKPQFHSGHQLNTPQ